MTNEEAIIDLSIVNKKLEEMALMIGQAHGLNISLAKHLFQANPEYSSKLADTLTASLPEAPEGFKEMADQQVNSISKALRGEE